MDRSLSVGSIPLETGFCDVLIKMKFMLVTKAGLEPDKGGLSDKEMAKKKAIAGPYGTGVDPPDGDKMVTNFPESD